MEPDIADLAAFPGAGWEIDEIHDRGSAAETLIEPGPLSHHLGAARNDLLVCLHSEFVQHCLCEIRIAVTNHVKVFRQAYRRGWR